MARTIAEIPVTPESVRYVKDSPGPPSSEVDLSGYGYGIDPSGYGYGILRASVTLPLRLLMDRRFGKEYRVLVVDPEAEPEQASDENE